MNKIININKSALRIACGVLRWHISRYIFGRDFPLLATFQLTNKCNLKCRMCNIKNNPRQGTLPFSVFKNIIDELSGIGTVYVTLSGGEPLMIGGILDYVAYAKLKIPFVNLVTNGYFLTKGIAEGLGTARLDSLSVSIDALAERNDSIRGAGGAFFRAVSAIEMMKKHAPHAAITVNTVISCWNLEDIPALVELTASLGVRHKFQPVYLHPKFDGQVSEYEQPRTDGASVPKIKAVVEYLKTKKHVANSAYYLDCITEYFTCAYRKKIFYAGCIYPSFACEFTQDGLIYPCIFGKEWRNGYDIKGGIKPVIESRAWQDDVKKLKSCCLCRRNFSICYVESRLALPVTNLLYYNFLYRLNLNIKNQISK